MNDDRCLQNAVTVALNYEKIKNHPERINNIVSFINQYDWNDINVLPHKENWNEFEKNNKTISLNVLYIPHNSKKIKHAYKSKYNLKCKNEVILLMITDGNKWHYLAGKHLVRIIYIHIPQKIGLKNIRKNGKVMSIAS